MGFMTRVREVPTVETLKSWNIWLAVVYGLQAVAVLVVGSAQLAPLTSSFLTVDSLLSTTTGKLVLAPASHHLFDLNLLYVAFAVMAALAVGHASQATWFKNKYEAGLQQNYNHVRWATYGFSASVTFIVLAIFAGVTDISLLLLLLILSVVLYSLCAWAERTVGLRGRAKNGAWFGLGMAALVGLAMWLVVVIYLVADNVYGAGHIPARVYWLAVTAAVTALSIIVGLVRQIQKTQTGNRYRLVERNFMILTLATTSLLIWQIVAGTMQ
jgi:hypothetical protein